MNTAATAAAMTAEEFLAWASDPERGDAHYELTEEGIVEMPTASEFHNLQAIQISSLLVDFVKRRGAGRVAGTDTAVIVARNPDIVRAPDVIFYPTSKTFRQMREQRNSNEIPSLIVEILSPSDRPGATEKRVQNFLLAGVSLVWIVDPDGEIVTVHKRGSDPLIRRVGDTLDGNAVLPDLGIPVADIFKLPGE